MRAPYLSDPDFSLYLGDAREVARELPEGCVDCIVTSPPYWGLRDYGTAEWEGGDPDHEHRGSVQRTAPPGSLVQANNTGANAVRSGDCDCGARRIDSQIGLEVDAEGYVAELVELFGELRRALVPSGTLWLNLGDTYADKSLAGIPWRVAFALQADGWFLRCDVIWSKPNPMPESITDRPTKSHEYVFLLAKRARYFYDHDAISEPSLDPESLNGRRARGPDQASQQDDDGRFRTRLGFFSDEIVGRTYPMRNARSVWEIPINPYSGAHFATFPERLPHRCISAGCPERVCMTCGMPSERIIEVTRPDDYDTSVVDLALREATGGRSNSRPLGKIFADSLGSTRQTVGWTDCGHNDWRRGVVLDPFMGSGTVALVARKLARSSIGIELNPDYAAMSARRLQQLSLFAEVGA